MGSGVVDDEESVIEVGDDAGVSGGFAFSICVSVNNDIAGEIGFLRWFVTDLGEEIGVGHRGRCWS